MRIFSSDFDLSAVVAKTRALGAVFIRDALAPSTLALLAREAARLPFGLGDHERHPINRGAANEVRQMHERCYRPLGHPDVPIATRVSDVLAADVAWLGVEDLRGWQPNEIGYQRYRGTTDWISPHRDRESDRLLSVTFTLEGAALMRLHAATTDPTDYRRLRPVAEFMTDAGAVMFLRAPGFGSGERVIHEVLPPTRAPRTILNLRMRPTVLKPPDETKWK